MSYTSSAFVDISGTVWSSRQAYEDYRQQRREITKQALTNIW